MFAFHDRTVLGHIKFPLSRIHKTPLPGLGLAIHYDSFEANLLLTHLAFLISLLGLIIIHRLY